MESVFIKLKGRVDEKSNKEEVEKILRLKANTTEVKKYMQHLEEKILQV